MDNKIEIRPILQEDSWPKGSACVCAVMLLQYMGLQISVDEFIDNFLPQHKIRYREGFLTGPDPDVQFVGSPYDAKSFGCYPGVIVRAMNECFRQKGLTWRAEDATGLSTRELLAASLDRGMPPIYWVTGDMKPPVLELSWQIRGTDRRASWYRNCSCMLMTGCDSDTMTFLDPAGEAGPLKVSRMLAVKRHAELGKRSVIVRKE